MIAAIYSRKSNEQNDVADPEKSVARQITLGRAFAAEKGWSVIEEYVDDGISGREADRLTSRARMLAHAAEGKFQTLIVRDLDRLSRNDRELPMLIFALEEAGVEVWEYLSRSRVETETALQRGMLYMKGTFAGAEAEQASKRTREQKYERAARAVLADGRVLGYRNVGERLSRRREIDPEEAKIVIRIFELASQGVGIRRIARTLNADGTKNPVGRRVSKSAPRRDRWAGSGIREVLHRRLYLGEVSYGRTRNKRTGKRLVKIAGDQPVPPRHHPELQIIPDDLWAAAHDRMKRTHAAYLRQNNGRLGGKPASGLESRYLLTGFLRCAICGSNLIVLKSQGKRGRPGFYYTCAGRRNRPGSCTWERSLPEQTITDAVMTELREHFLNPAALGDLLLAEFEERQRAPEQREAERRDLTTRIADLDGKITNLLDVIESGKGGSAPELLQRIEARRAERRDVQAKLDALAPIKPEEFDLNVWYDETRDLLGNFRETLEASPTVGRQLLRYILPEPIRIHPERDPAGQVVSFRFEGVARFEGANFDLATGRWGDRVKEQPLTGQVLIRRRSADGVWLPGLGSNQRLPD